MYKKTSSQSSSCGSFPNFPHLRDRFADPVQALTEPQRDSAGQLVPLGDGDGWPLGPDTPWVFPWWNPKIPQALVNVPYGLEYFFHTKTLWYLLEIKQIPNPQYLEPPNNRWNGDWLVYGYSSKYLKQSSNVGVNKCHRQPMWEWFITCYTTYKNGDDWGMVYDCSPKWWNGDLVSKHGGIDWCILGYHWEINNWLVVGTPTPLKNDGVKVSWDYDIPNQWNFIKVMFRTTNQSINHYYIYY